MIIGPLHNCNYSELLEVIGHYSQLLDIIQTLMIIGPPQAPEKWWFLKGFSFEKCFKKWFFSRLRRAIPPHLLEIDCINRFTVFLVKFANFVMVVIGPPNHHQSTNQFNSKSFGDFGSAYIDFFQLLFHNCSGTMCSLQFYSIKSKTRKNTYAIKLKS